MAAFLHNNLNKISRMFNDSGIRVFIRRVTKKMDGINFNNI